MPVIAICPAYNEIEIAINSFENMDLAIKYYTKLGLQLEENGVCKYFSLKGKLELQCGGNGNCLKCDGRDDGCSEEEQKTAKGFHFFMKKIFKDGYYYGGCGEASRIELREVNFGEPFCSFDLD